MDIAKLDAGLLSSLRRYETIPDRTYTVFIHTSGPLNADNVLFLRELGMERVKAGQKVVTATLPAPAIDTLSDQEWVSAIRLSRKMRPL